MAKSDNIDQIAKLNYWDKPLIDVGYLRKSYLDQFENYIGNKLIKVLNGQRRSGKSFLMKQIMHFLINKKNIDPRNILYLNFENEVLSSIKDKEDLNQTIKLYLETIPKKTNEKLYFFFDEIQEVEEWEKLINSYNSDDQIDLEIFITGSNSKLLSSELASYLTGRFVELKIYPINYDEYLDIKDLPRTQDSFINFLEHSQLPELIFEENLELKKSYIRTIKDSILLNDIVQRFKVQNVDLLEKLFLFLVDNISNPFSINSIEKKLEGLGYKTNVVTLGNYLKYLEYCFLFFAVERFNIKGKKILEGEKKYYLNDLGFRNYLSSSFDPGITKKLENYVYQKLIQSGYEVYVGNIDSDREVDFVAQKDSKTIYIQVTYILESQEVVDREYGNLEKIKDNWPKYVISMDKVSIHPKNGIEHLKAWDLSKLA